MKSTETFLTYFLPLDGLLRLLARPVRVLPGLAGGHACVGQPNGQRSCALRLCPRRDACSGRRWLRLDRSTQQRHVRRRRCILRSQPDAHSRHRLGVLGLLHRQAPVELPGRRRRRLLHLRRLLRVTGRVVPRLLDQLLQSAHALLFIRRRLHASRARRPVDGDAHPPLGRRLHRRGSLHHGGAAAAFLGACAPTLVATVAHASRHTSANESIGGNPAAAASDSGSGAAGTASIADSAGLAARCTTRRAPDVYPS